MSGEGFEISEKSLTHGKSGQANRRRFPATLNR
jgi:hypothetical protein